jgi:chromosome segregation ATPase
MLLVEERVDTLESVLKDFIAHTDRLESQMDRLEEDTIEFKKEMREFKDEMREFKDEMSNFKRESNKQWGALANKMGTIDEDLIAPLLDLF